jgi:hypothetical protein
MGARQVIQLLTAHFLPAIYCDAAGADIRTRTEQSSHASETGILPLPFGLSHASNVFTTILP